MEVGIVGYGVYIPRYRIKVEEIAKVWGTDAERVKRGLFLEEKSVPGPDEDAATIAVEAARNAVKLSGINPQDIGAIYVGSESHPYAVKPTATIVAEAIEATPDLTAADYEFACKAGTAGIQTCMGMVGSNMIKYGMAIGTDTAQSAPGDPLEYTAAAGAGAVIVGKDDDQTIASIEDTYSYTTDTPDFWRREMRPYPKHGGRFTGKPAYFKHVLSAAHGLLRKLQLTPKDFAYAVFHQPNGKFPLQVGKELGFVKEQIMPGLIVQKIGNTYSGASMIGLATVLDQAKPGERILVVSYGSGSGSDAFSIMVKDGIEAKRNIAPKVADYVNNKTYIDYSTYVKFKQLLVR
ncbi:MAG: hydroxymethylglutaryl-CoA synthase [Hadesarchaea archaeon CG08_land_8_20_14_0_20_51_8]|nr:MAG: hydroxymethylglutaryl-CoA synthase [Hadesarchaea archaeon CG08_land_8_20_14_0_20_51_8]